MSDNIYTKLSEIQAELNVPKKRYNQFAKNPFYYRNVEDIMEAAKPICHKHGCVLTLTDKIKQLGDRFYVEAEARLCDGEGSISTTASAREEESRKGFDSAQLTGSASSYARKYALNGLLGLDDNNDPDSGLTCPRCGNPIEGYVGKSGYRYSPEETLQHLGMCVECARAEKS